MLRLRLATPGGTNATVGWQNVAGVSYFLERRTDLASPLVLTPLVTILPGQDGTTG